jgi:hypothetical protein
MSQCSRCHFRDINRRYCFSMNIQLDRNSQIEQIKKGLVNECEFFEENLEPLIGEIEERK